MVWGNELGAFAQVSISGDTRCPNFPTIHSVLPRQPPIWIRRVRSGRVPASAADKTVSPMVASVSEAAAYRRSMTAGGIGALSSSAK